MFAVRWRLVPRTSFQCKPSTLFPGSKHLSRVSQKGHTNDTSYRITSSSLNVLITQVTGKNAFLPEIAVWFYIRLPVNFLLINATYIRNSVV